MKRIFLSLSIVLMVLLISVVFADMGAPEIHSYKATPKRTEGASYYSYTYEPATGTPNLIEDGVLPYGTIIDVNFESTENGIQYGHFSYGEGNAVGNYQVKLEDMTVANASEKEPMLSSTYRNMKVLANDVMIYSGPAYIYDAIGTIPKGTQIFARRIARVNDYDGSEYEESMNPWLYVEYNGVGGWICELNSAIGEFCDKELILLVDVSVSGDEIAIPASTKINGYYQTDAWTGNAYVTYNDKDYLISMYDCAVDATKWYPNGMKINYNKAKLFKMPSKNSEVLADIPNGSVVPVKYMQYDLRWIGWIFTEYNGVEGWTLFFESDDAIKEYESGEFSIYEPHNGEATLVEKPAEPVQQNEPEQTEKPISTAKPEINSAPQPLVSNTVIYIGIAVIIALTATVVILLINRKKN